MSRTRTKRETEGDGRPRTTRSGRVAGKVALVTGAARGQGRSHAIRLAEEGADIIAIDACTSMATVPWALSSREDLDDTVRGIERLDRRVYAAVADVRDREGLHTAISDGFKALGRLDIVCANAGIGSYGRTWELTPEAWDEMIAVNLTGVWNTIKASVPILLEQGEGGSIILTSSTAGIKSIPDGGHYSAAKRGVVGLAHSLAQEVGPYFVRVNTVHPTGVATPMIHNDFTYRLFLPHEENPVKDDLIPLVQRMNAIPVPWIDPVDVSNAVLFLASDESRYVTGCQLTIDAGATVKYAGAEVS